jgi:ParB-like chromosome segregation protein Spo0J
MGHTDKMKVGQDGADPRVSFERVSVDSLTPHPKNARRSDMDLISASLRAHGQYRSIVAQRSTRYILAGNHVYLAARALGFKQLDVHFLDVNDEDATRILLLDNRVSELGDFDGQALLEALQDVPDLEGTGYARADLDALFAELNEARPEKQRAEKPRRGGSSARAPSSKARVSGGDLFLLGADRIACVDARDLEALTKLFGRQADNLALVAATVEAAVDSPENSFAGAGVALYVITAPDPEQAPDGGTIITVLATAGSNTLIAQTFSGVGEQLVLSDTPDTTTKTALIPDTEACLQLIEAWELETGAHAGRAS